MSAAFTPGPWKIFRASNGSMLGIGVDRPSDSDHAMGVADAYGGLWGGGGEKEANARLIAAAPELYEALNALLQTSDEEGHYHDLNVVAVDKAERALAKARGGK